MLVTAMFILPYFPWFKNIKFYFVGFRALVLRMLLFLFRLLFSSQPASASRKLRYDARSQISATAGGTPAAGVIYFLFLFLFSFPTPLQRHASYDTIGPRRFLHD
jgi:hypothetical protein